MTSSIRFDIRSFLNAIGHNVAVSELVVIAAANRLTSRRKTCEEDGVMIDECVVAVYGNVDKAHESIKQLIGHNTPSDRISLVTISLRDNRQ